jgi:HlyD family secretion protein
MAKKKSNKLIFILVGVLLLLILLAIIGKSAGWIGQPKTTKVEIGEVGEARIIEKVSASGLIQPVYEVRISPDVSGEIIELNVEEGDSVQRYDVLLKIRPDIYESSLERAIANLNQQQANLADARARVARAEAQSMRAEAEYERQQQLFEDKVISEADMQLAEANYKVATNDLESARQNVRAAEYVIASARATVQEAEENLRFTTITAPVSGIVSKLNVELGERVVGTAQMAGTELLRIADLSKMEARVDVNENDIIRLELGDTAIVDVDAYAHTGKKFKGVVTNIANTANDKTSPDAVTEFEVRILLLNESYNDLMTEEQAARSPFRPGMTASVDIITEVADNVLSVPLSAVTTRAQDDIKNGKSDSTQANKSGQKDVYDKLAGSDSDVKEVVFVVKDGKAVKVPVETGISDFDHIQILSGVEKGQQVVTGPFVVVSKQLKDGELVSADEENEQDGE